MGVAHNLLDPLAGAPDHPAAWAAAYRHATGGHEALLREAPPGVVARLALLEALPGGARRALAREVIAGPERGALELLAARMGAADGFTPPGGRPRADVSDDEAMTAAAVATGGPAEARRAFTCGFEPEAVVDRYIPAHVGGTLAGEPARSISGTRDHAGALAALAGDPAALEFYRRRHAAARARLREYVRWRAAVAAAAAACDPRAGAVLARTDAYFGC